MRVTFLLPYASLSGGIRVVRIYAERLAARGHDVQIVSTSYRFPRRRERAAAALRHAWWRLRGIEEPSHLSDIAVPHTRLDHPGPITAADVPDADVVVATWWETVEWAAALRPEKGTKVHFIQGFETHGNQPTERVEATWRLPFHKIAVAQWLADLARERFDADGVSLVPNAVDGDRFDAPPREKRRVPRVGCIYDDNPIKGCAAAMEAVALARGEYPDLEFLSFGVGPEQPHLPLLPGTIYTCRPAQNELAALYASCDAWIFASELEGFGLPILEAMACRTPVIATHAGAAPELVGRGGGVLVHGYDAASIAGGIVDVIGRDGTSWRVLSDAAYETGHIYNWDHATDLFEHALQHAVNADAGGSTSPGAAKTPISPIQETFSHATDPT